MNDIEILANIFSNAKLHKKYMLIFNGSEAKAYKGGNGEWYLQNEVTGEAIALDECEDFGWAKDIVSFTCRGEGFYLQIVQVLDLNLI